MEVRARRLADLILCSLPCLQGRVGVGSLFVTEDQKPPPSLPLQAGGGAKRVLTQQLCSLLPAGEKQRTASLASSAPSPACRGGSGWGRSSSLKIKSHPLPTSPGEQGEEQNTASLIKLSPSSQREERSCPRSPALLPSLTSSVGANTSSRMPTRCAPCIYGRRSRRECRQTRWRYCRRAKSLPSPRQ